MHQFGEVSGNHLRALINREYFQRPTIAVHQIGKAAVVHQIATGGGFAAQRADFEQLGDRVDLSLGYILKLYHIHLHQMVWSKEKTEEYEKFYEN